MLTVGLASSIKFLLLYYAVTWNEPSPLLCKLQVVELPNMKKENNYPTDRASIARTQHDDRCA
jgi:hypothetical protein